jgi:hypothetical protein
MSTSKKVFTVVILLALSISLSFADETRSHQFDSKLVSSLTIDISLGSIVVQHSESDTIEITTTLRNERNRWFGRSQDLSNLDLNPQMNGSELTLSFDEKHVKVELIIDMPKTNEISINLGVGTVELVLVEADSVDINLGVGALEIQMLEKLAGNLNLSAGVGETEVQGAQQVRSSRAIVSSQLTANGSGKTDIVGYVGVGSAKVALN